LNTGANEYGDRLGKTGKSSILLIITKSFFIVQNQKRSPNIQRKIPERTCLKMMFKSALDSMDAQPLPYYEYRSDQTK